MINEELYRYKTLYEIVSEENKMLKEANMNMGNRIRQLEEMEEARKAEIQNRPAWYRGLRKIYHLIKR